MKTINAFLCGAAILLSSACAPQVYNLSVESRQPSKSGLELYGKTLSIVYDETESQAAFSHAFAECFASELEKEYFSGEQQIGVFSADFSKGDYACRDSMVSLVMQTDADVVFLLPGAEVGNVVHTSEKQMAPVTIKMYAYDSLGGEKDKVRSFSGTTTISGDAGSEDFLPVLVSNAPDMAKRVSKSFLSVWADENVPIYYYDTTDGKWLEAAALAYRFKWKEAMEAWMKLLSTKNMEKKACAEYNIATGCVMLGDLDLATRWLDRADSDCTLSLSGTLRRKIINKKK